MSKAIPFDLATFDQFRRGPRYLNASWVLERLGNKWWVASQAPLPQTVHAFLSLICQPVTLPPPSILPNPPSRSPTTQVRTVVQLTRDVEGGRRKAHPYFPNEVGQSLVVPPDDSEGGSPALSVTLLKSEDVPDCKCTKSTISVVPISNTSTPNQSATIFTHLAYLAWPDHGVPEEEDRASLFNFIHLADTINRDRSLSSYPPSSTPDPNLDPDPPIIVGCSAGVGRTGSFIALSSLLRHYGELPPPAFPTPASVLPPSALGPLPQELQEDLIVQEIDSLREQRQRMVDRPEQTILIYEMLLEFLSRSA